MIVDEQLVIEYLTKWLADYAKQSGKTVFVVTDRGTREDKVTIELCRKATKVSGGLKIHICSRHWPQGIVIKTDTEMFLKCHEYADENNGVVVGSVERTFGFLWREYQKMGDGLADIFPLYNIEYSEIIQLYDYLVGGIFSGRFSPNYKMIEFCNNMDILYNIITSDDPPHVHKRWPYFTQEQKKWIANTHQREKKTRHKILNKPYPIISDKPQLCRRNVQ